MLSYRERKKIQLAQYTSAYSCKLKLEENISDKTKHQCRRNEVTKMNGGNKDFCLR